MNIHNVSGVPQYAELLSNQKKALKDAQTRVGQKMKQGKSRAEIIMQFQFRQLMGRQRQLSRGSRVGFNIRSSFIPPAYSPSLRSITDLRKIVIKDLLLETHHRDNYIIVRSVTPADRMNAVMAVVEDEKSDVLVLQLYHQEEENTRAAEDLVGKGTVLIIKEPYLKMMSDGDYGIRIDHPSDLIHLPRNDPRIPSCWRSSIKELESSAEYLRKEGNNYFNASNYHAAIELWVFYFCKL